MSEFDSVFAGNIFKYAGCALPNETKM